MRPRRPFKRDLVLVKKHIPKKKDDLELYLFERRKNWIKILNAQWKKHKSFRFDIYVEAELSERGIVHLRKFAYRSITLGICKEEFIIPHLEQIMKDILDALSYRSHQFFRLENKIKYSALNIYCEPGYWSKEEILEAKKRGGLYKEITSPGSSEDSTRTEKEKHKLSGRSKKSVRPENTKSDEMIYPGSSDSSEDSWNSSSDSSEDSWNSFPNDW
jgi:hypothetical protein